MTRDLSPLAVVQAQLDAYNAKNIDAFLKLDLPGSKVVYGVGPMLERLQAEYPGVHWRGVVPRVSS